MELLIIIIIFFVFKNKFNNFNNKLNIFLNNNNFSNITRDTSTPGITIINANSDGENHLFSFKNDNSTFSIRDIDMIYEYAQKKHIHNVILLTAFSSFSPDILKKIKEYDMQVWNHNKLNSMLSLNNSSSVLKTSNTSDDTCKIDTSSYDPIQEPTSFWKNVFKKPDRL